MIQRKHVGLHRRELTALRGRLRRTGDAPMRQEGGKKRKGNVQRMKGNEQMRQERGKKRKGNVQRMKGNVQMRQGRGKMRKGNGPTQQLNMLQKKHTDV